MNSHALFAVIGMIIGCATVGMIGKSFVDEHGRKLIPLFIGLAIVVGAVLAWSINAWFDYAQYTGSTTGGGP